MGPTVASYSGRSTRITVEMSVKSVWKSLDSMIVTLMPSGPVSQVNT